MAVVEFIFASFYILFIYKCYESSYKSFIYFYVLNLRAGLWFFFWLFLLDLDLYFVIWSSSERLHVSITSSSPKSCELLQKLQAVSVRLRRYQPVCAEQRQVKLPKQSWLAQSSVHEIFRFGCKQELRNNRYLHNRVKKQRMNIILPN